MQGSVIDNRYDIVRPLGSGGMGEVYLARDRTLGRDVALKVLRSQYANDRESAERFKREATSAAGLSHPNIVQVYDRGDTEDGSSYIAMEYVPGGTLKERIVAEGPLDARLAASYGYQVAEALGAAHAKGVVHRDIKPQNVLITASGAAKVGDFGIARAASAAGDAQTKTGTVMGTAGYMAPEQALGRPATPESDLYSLGVVLYEMLTGRLPFTADNPVAVSMKHVNEAPRPPKDLNPAVPEGMNAVVMKLLSKSPEDRYPDAEALAEDLWQVRSGLPVAAAGAVAGADEARTVEAPTNRLAPDARRKTPAPARAKRSRAPFVLAALLLLLGLAGVGLALAGGTASGVEVASVEGLPEDEAVSRLESAGFRTEVRTGEGGGEAGTVTGQSPPGGSRAREGSTVTLTVAASTVAVPDVVGQDLAGAEAELQGAGLTVGSTYDVQGEGAAEGVVVEQGFAAGAEVQPGTPVNLGLSTGQTAPASASPASSPDASASQDPDSSPQPSDPSADASADASASPAADPQSEEESEAAEKAREEAQKAREEAAESEEFEAPKAKAPKAKGPKAAGGKGKAKGKQ
ncbi:MAG: Stk1 family PASTA domain-containing Ser/Thr kinase [Actinomycetota bacterium]|nr:Stk1 family PASTA domain-containing Ser/Thr kinase [Actinomycetota bacterium]